MFNKTILSISINVFAFRSQQVKTFSFKNNKKQQFSYLEAEQKSFSRSVVSAAHFCSLLHSYMLPVCLTTLCIMLLITANNTGEKPLQTRPPLHLTRLQLIPGFKGLVLRKYSCNLGLKPPNPPQQQWLRSFDILILVIDHGPPDDRKYTFPINLKIIFQSLKCCF